jgi:hypothetical protein
VVPAVLATAWGCGQDKGVAFARMLERAASWSASVSFAEEMAQQSYVPHTYIHDLLSTAAEELDTLAQQIDGDEAVSADQRAAASGTCRQLTSTLRDADRAGSIPDAATLRALELRLRAAAQAARGAATPRQRS